MRTASWQMNTCVAEARSLGMLDVVTAEQGEMGVMCRKWDLSLCLKSDGLGREVGGDGVKNSPGKRRVVP